MKTKFGTKKAILKTLDIKSKAIKKEPRFVKQESSESEPVDESEEEDFKEWLAKYMTPPEDYETFQELYGDQEYGDVAAYVKEQKETIDRLKNVLETGTRTKTMPVPERQKKRNDISARESRISNKIEMSTVTQIVADKN